MGNCMRLSLSSGCKSSGFNDAQETRWKTFRLFREFDRHVRLFFPLDAADSCRRLIFSQLQFQYFSSSTKYGPHRPVEFVPAQLVSFRSYC
jgi:hypothetical protein